MTAPRRPQQLTDWQKYSRTQEVLLELYEDELTRLVLGTPTDDDLDAVLRKTVWGDTAPIDVDAVVQAADRHARISAPRKAVKERAAEAAARLKPSIIQLIRQGHGIGDSTVTDALVAAAFNYSTVQTRPTAADVLAAARWGKKK